MCGRSVWNALNIRLPVEKYLTSQHRTPHVVRLAAQASCYRRINESHANRPRATTGDPVRVKMEGNISDVKGMLFSDEWTESLQ